MTEKKYVFDFVFSEIFGIAFEFETSDKPEFVLSYCGLELSFSSEFLEDDTNLNNFVGEINSFELLKPQELTLQSDLFGACFYFLTCYREFGDVKRDKHNRVVCEFKQVETPIVDHIIEFIWCKIAKTWPNLVRREKVFKMNITCDVDQPYLESSTTISKTIRRMVGDIVKRTSVRKMVLTALRYLDFKLGFLYFDPYYKGIFYLMDQAEKHGLKITFYFICRKGVGPYDARYSIEDEIIVKLFSIIKNRGHEIGIHGSYDSYNSEILLKEEVNTLSIALGYRNEKRVLGGRQHYLRWEPGKSQKILESIGLKYDSTLGFADRVGFRVGTSHEHYMYDLYERRKLSLRQKPLIVMECSVFDTNYMGLTDKESALRKMCEMKQKCMDFGGTYTLLWHNSSFNNKSQKEIFDKVVRYNE
tara:strand:+ start:590 stop:1840 length:1251 start_codon:yes stop_codon:yes gene_type:complete